MATAKCWCAIEVSPDGLANLSPWGEHKIIPVPMTRQELGQDLFTEAVLTNRWYAWAGTQLGTHGNH